MIQENFLLDSLIRMNETERRIIYLASQAINKKISAGGSASGAEIIIRWGDFCQIFNERLDDAELRAGFFEAKNLIFDRTFTYMVVRDDGLHQKFTSYWVSAKSMPIIPSRDLAEGVAYVDSDLELSFVFSDIVTKTLAEMGEDSLMLNLKRFKGLSSKYSVYLLGLLEKNSQPFEISYEELRKTLGVLESEYRVLGDFKKRVLGLAIEQLQNSVEGYTDLSVETLKDGVKVTGFAFKW